MLETCSALTNLMETLPDNERYSWHPHGARAHPAGALLGRVDITAAPRRGERP